MNDSFNQKNLTLIALGLGSNLDRYRNINAGLNSLELHFGHLTLSPVYETQSIGFKGRPFLNLVALVRTADALEDVVRTLKRIEDENGRDRSAPKYSPRTLDIDVVTFGSLVVSAPDIELPRSELFTNAFVLKPMVDLLPDHSIPGREVTYHDYWCSRDFSHQWIRQVDFKRSH